LPEAPTPERMEPFEQDEGDLVLTDGSTKKFTAAAEVQ
jgi:hypothetical protein